MSNNEPDYENNLVFEPGEGEPEQKSNPLDPDDYGNLNYYLVLGQMSKGVEYFERKVSHWVEAGFRPSGNLLLDHGFFLQPMYREHGRQFISDELRSLRSERKHLLELQANQDREVDYLRYLLDAVREYIKEDMPRRLCQELTKAVGIKEKTGK